VAGEVAARPATAGSTGWLLGSGATLIVCWWALWTLRTYWNPAFFFGLWTGAIVFVRTLAGDEPMPWRRHLALSALSIPLWWWFELVNEWVDNWTYHNHVQYNDLEYTLFATLAFSTVVPALDAACRLAFRLLPGTGKPGPYDPVGARSPRPGGWLALELAAGLIAQALIIAIPTIFYPLVWVAPFLVLDALVAMRGGANLMTLIARRRLALPIAVALAGVGCGFCWELWNVGASPKWTYDIPYVGFLKVFEMPILGYGGYVPLAWSVYQLVHLVSSFGFPVSGGQQANSKPETRNPKLGAGSGGAGARP